MTHPLEASTIYVTFSGYRFNDYLPHVFRSTDLGATWEDISANLPEIPVNEIVIDPLLPNTYYLATDMGVFSSEDAGESWDIMGEELPPVIVNDLDLHSEKRELLAATFGYSMFTYPLPSEPLSTDAVFIDYFSIAPNPVNDILHIRYQEDLTPLRIEVVNINGQPMMSFTNVDNMDVSDLSAGNYILRITTEEGIEVEKFIKL